jgi:hypothetical protein
LTQRGPEPKHRSQATTVFCRPLRAFPQGGPEPFGTRQSLLFKNIFPKVCQALVSWPRRTPRRRNTADPHPPAAGGGPKAMPTGNTKPLKEALGCACGGIRQPATAPPALLPGPGSDRQGERFVRDCARDGRPLGQPACTKGPLIMSGPLSGTHAGWQKIPIESGASANAPGSSGRRIPGRAARPRKPWHR